jgi:hypothetical protein
MIRFRQAEVSGKPSHTLRISLLDAAVRDICIGFVRQPLAEHALREIFLQLRTERHGVSLAQWPEVFRYAAHYIASGVRVWGSPTAERFEIIDREERDERKRRIEHV